MYAIVDLRHATVPSESDVLYIFALVEGLLRKHGRSLKEQGLKGSALMEHEHATSSLHSHMTSSF